MSTNTGNNMYFLRNIRLTSMFSDNLNVTQSAGEIYSRKFFEEKIISKSVPTTSREYEDTDPTYSWNIYSESEDDDFLSSYSHDETVINRRELPDPTQAIASSEAIVQLNPSEHNRHLSDTTYIPMSEYVEMAPKLQMRLHMPFLYYLRFNGVMLNHHRFNQVTRVSTIFMTMLPEKLKKNPLTICVIASAKIQELIGLTCYRYSVEYPDIKLLPVCKYGLYLTGEEGNADRTFQCFDPNSPCATLTNFCTFSIAELNPQPPIPEQLPQDNILNDSFDLLTLEDF